MDQKKIEAIFTDPKFVAKLIELDSSEAVQAACKEKGVDLSIAEIEAIRKGVAKKMSGQEISEEELEEVSGGVVISLTIAIVGCVVGVIATAAVLVDRASDRRW